MSSKCKVRKTWPAIGSKGCTAQTPPKMPWTHEQRTLLLRKKMDQLKEIVKWTKTAHDVLRITKEVNAAQKKTNTRLEKANAAATKINAAATRQKIIGPNKVARGRKHMALH
jgi:hypothetical protein